MNLPQSETLVLVALVEAAIIIKLWLDLRAMRREVHQLVAADNAGDPDNLVSLYSKALTGSLDRFSVGEVLQFLNSIHETGILDIHDEKISAVHRLLMEDGNIIDAYNGDHRGEEAVRGILQCQEGSFTFIRGDLPSEERVIQKPTMSLLMECFQFQDEAALHTDDTIPAGNLFQAAAK